MSIATERRRRVSVTVGGQEITFETGKLAKQADGAVVVRSGDTMVLATAQGRTEAREGADFFPLTVDVEERMYAAGKIPGGFFKREGRPTERAILTARMIDRPIRPLWPKGFRNEVQVICTVLSADLVTAHDILCINGASAALMISPLPFFGPVGAVRVGPDRRRARRQPDAAEAEDESTLDLIVVGTKDGADDGRGRRRARSPRTRCSRRSSSRTRRSRSSARRRRSCARKAGKAEVARRRRSPPSSRRSTAPAIRERIERGRPPRGRRARRGAPGRARARAVDGVDRGRHRPRRSRSARASRCSSSSSGSTPSRARSASSSRTTCAR